MKRAKSKILLALNYFFQGMASAEHKMTSQQTSSEDSEIVQHVGVGGVFDDFTKGQETEAVREWRDKYYRVYRKADEYEPVVERIVHSDGEVEMMFKGMKKKDASFFVKHPPVFEEEGYKLRTIQDNKHVVKKNGFVGLDEELPEDYFGTGLYDYQVTLTVDRDGIIPSFELDKFVTRMVVRNSEEDPKKARVDFYVPETASQFGKIDAILISKLHKMYDLKDYRSNFTEFKSFEWFSDKAWGEKDVALFKYENVKLIDMHIFDGSFVLTYDCDIVNDGFDLAERYHTAELDKKYEEEAPKKKHIDVYTLQRKIERDKKKAKNNENKNTENENSDRP